MRRISSLFWVWLVFDVKFQVLCNFVASPAILSIFVNRTESSSYCIRYFSEFSTLPALEEEAVLHPLLDLTPLSGCDGSNDVDFDGKVVVVQLPNCTLVEKAIRVRDKGGVGLLVVVPNGQTIEVSYNRSQYENVNVSLGLISNAILKDIKLLGGTNVQVLQYAPQGVHIDYSLFVIWFLAVLCVTMGAVWSRDTKFYLCNKNAKTSDRSSLHSGESRDASLDVSSEDSTLKVTPKLIVCFVVCMCVMLLLLYFFYNYLVYLIILLFCLCSTSGLYRCLTWIPMPLSCCHYRLPRFSSRICNQMPDIWQVLLFTGCVSLTLCWFVFRKHSFAWILQDILGIAFTVNLLTTARLPNFKICTILLVLLFFYDIFFVFITPLLTKNGESVMVEVATGGSSQEQMPMVLKVPHLSSDPLAPCYLLSYSLLGFGDILVPGLLVSFCYGFDIEKRIRWKIYFVTSFIGYCFGLIFAFVGLYVIASAQPALLYLVPSMLIPLTLFSLCRKEFRQFWNGDVDSADHSFYEGSDSQPAIDKSLPQSIGNIADCDSRRQTSNSDVASRNLTNSRFLDN